MSKSTVNFPDNMFLMNLTRIIIDKARRRNPKGAPWIRVDATTPMKPAKAIMLQNSLSLNSLSATFTPPSIDVYPNILSLIIML